MIKQFLNSIIILFNPEMSKDGRQATQRLHSLSFVEASILLENRKDIIFLTLKKNQPCLGLGQMITHIQFQSNRNRFLRKLTLFC